VTSTQEEDFDDGDDSDESMEGPGTSESKINQGRSKQIKKKPS